MTWNGSGSTRGHNCVCCSPPMSAPLFIPRHLRTNLTTVPRPQKDPVPPECPECRERESSQAGGTAANADEEAARQPNAGVAG